MVTGPIRARLFDALDARFRALSDAGLLAIDGPDIGPWLPDRRIPLAELRDRLLDRHTTTDDLRDDALHALAARARTTPDPWTLALSGTLLPGLRNSYRSFHAGSYAATISPPAVADDVQTAMIAAVLHTARRLPPTARKVAARLLYAAEHAARQHLYAERQQAATTPPLSIDDPDHGFANTLHADPTPGRDPSLAVFEPTTPQAVLAEAVAEGVITADDADILVRTKLNDEDLHDLAEQRGIPYDTLRKRRQRAGHLIEKWIASGKPSGTGTDATPSDKRKTGGRPRLATSPSPRPADDARPRAQDTQPDFHTGRAG